MADAFERAWSLVKALPEQQAFEQMRANHPSDVEHWDIDHANWADMGGGMRSAGTIHPAILGMMQRRMDERMATVGAEPGAHPPTTNLSAAQEADDRDKFGMGGRRGMMSRHRREERDAMDPDELADKDAQGHNAGTGLISRDSWPELAEPAQRNMERIFPWLGAVNQTDQERHWVSHPTRDEEGTPGKSDGEMSWRQFEHDSSDDKRQRARDDEMRSDEDRDGDGDFLMGQDPKHDENQYDGTVTFGTDGEDNPRVPFR